MCGPQWMIALSTAERAVVDASSSVVAGNVVYINLYPCRIEDLLVKSMV